MERRRWAALVCAVVMMVLAAVSAMRAGGPGSARRREQAPTGDRATFDCDLRYQKVRRLKA